MSFEKKMSVALPLWLPDDAKHYILHTVYGQPIRALSRQAGCHASTILRQVRKVEARRDDPLMDDALSDVAAGSGAATGTVSDLEQVQALRRMSDPGAMLACAREMETGVIVRKVQGEDAERAASIDIRIAYVLALRDWIEPSGSGGRVSRYRITGAGRVGLRDLVAKSENRAREMAEAPAEFLHAGARSENGETRKSRHVRLSSAESPVHALARRKDRDGEHFLSRDMVRAAERLREEFEVAHVGAVVSQDWNAMLSAGIDNSRSGVGSGSDAKQHVEAAFTALGPGLAEVVYRTCCLMEGLEATEKRMGWSARSGKIVHGSPCNAWLFITKTKAIAAHASARHMHRLQSGVSLLLMRIGPR